MAGQPPSPDFGPRFRRAIQGVYEMAAPPDEDMQATFFFPSQLVYVDDPDPTMDGAGTPFDPETTVQRVTPDPVRVPCSVTYFDDQGEVTRLGLVTPSRIAVDLLDEDYEKVEGASYVVVGGDKYVYRRTEPPSGLFDVGLFTMHFSAEQER